MTLRVSTPNSFSKSLKRLKNPSKQEATIAALTLFMQSPHSPKLNFEGLRGRRGFFSIRVDYETRVLLREVEKNVHYEAVAVGNHDLIYESYFRT
jgi:hypothetical protein